MTSYHKEKIKVHSISAFTFVQAGGTQIDDSIQFDQDAQIIAVFCEKPANGTLQIKIEPDVTNDGPSIILGNLDMAVADVSKHFQTPTPLMGGEGRLTILSAAVTGNKKVTIYVRALPAAGRGF